MARKNWYGLKQAMLLPKLEMDRNLMLIGLQQARENLKRRLEEADIWDKLYENEKMLKTSLTNRFTWGDVLDGMVDILPPREMEPLYQTQAQANKKFITFKAKKMKELFGTQRPHKPSYKNLYEKGRNPKEINDRNFKSLIERHQSEKDRLFRSQNLHTPNLPRITEEDLITGEAGRGSSKSNGDTTANTSTSKSASTPELEVPRQDKQLRKTVHDSGGKEMVRKRKLSNVPVSKGTLTLAKSNIVLEGVPEQLKLPEQVSKKLQGNSKRKDSEDGLSGYTKLPPISNSDEL